MYINKEAFILKNSASKDLKIVIDLANHIKKNKKTTFHKMFDGTPNFHQ